MFNYVKKKTTKQIFLVDLLYRQLLVSICYKHVAHLQTKKKSFITLKICTLWNNTSGESGVECEVNMISPYWWAWRRTRPGSPPLCLCTACNGKVDRDRKLKEYFNKKKKKRGRSNENTLPSAGGFLLAGIYRISRIQKTMSDSRPSPWRVCLNMQSDQGVLVRNKHSAALPPSSTCTIQTPTDHQPLHLLQTNMTKTFVAEVKLDPRHRKLLTCYILSTPGGRPCPFPGKSQYKKHSYITCYYR